MGEKQIRAGGEAKDIIVERFRTASLEKAQTSKDAIGAAFKSMLLVHGGAIIALLTIVGNVSLEVEERALFWSFIWFGIGVFASLSGQWGIAYYNSNSSMALWLDTLKGEATANQADREANKVVYAKRARNWGLVTRVAVVVAMSMFLIGSFVALDAIT